MKKPLSPPPLELLDLATGYQRSKTLFALVEFGLPTLLSNEDLSLAEIADRLSLHPVAADRFVNACIALGLLEKVNGEFRNTTLSEDFLVRGKPTYLGDLLLDYDRNSYPIWDDLAGKLSNWEPAASEEGNLHQNRQFVASMRAHHSLSLMVGRVLGRAYDFSAHRKLLDLGGGTGAMSLGVCESHPKLNTVIFDLPAITAVASEFVAGSECGNRIEVRAGDFRTDRLPEDFDVVLLANLLSVVCEETNRALLKRLYELLPENGACILSGWILDNNRTSPIIPVLFCLQDINWKAPDVERSAATYMRWLSDAGFVEIEHRTYCPPTSMIVGRKLKHH